MAKNKNKKNKKKKNRTNVTRHASFWWFFGVMAAFIVLDALVAPYFLNFVVSKLPGINSGSFAMTKLEGEHLFLNFDWCFNLMRPGGYNRFLISLAFQLLVIALIIATFSHLYKGSMISGTEHGSARLLTDDEFDECIPQYDFEEDEYDKKKPWDQRQITCDEKTTIDIFSTFEYEKVTY